MTYQLVICYGGKNKCSNVIRLCHVLFGLFGKKAGGD